MTFHRNPVLLSSQRVEAYTLQKAANLVMNVDGCIGALFLDLLHSSSMFTEARSSDRGDVIISYHGTILSSVDCTARLERREQRRSRVRQESRLFATTSCLLPLPQAVMVRIEGKLLRQVEIKEVVDIGYLNGLFVLARSIGLIGATFDDRGAKVLISTVATKKSLAAAAGSETGRRPDFSYQCRPRVGSEAAATAAVPSPLG